MNSSPFPVSMLDLAIFGHGQTERDALLGSVELAKRAETRGYTRVWYAEHHNMASIASAATSVVIAHIAANTSTIRLGSGGIMLPNHAPLTIAEQFGTLATLHPGRIDLGLGRAPGSDQNTMRALRRDHTSSDTFPQDILELQGFLAGESRIPGVEAIPGRGTNVPIYILGSSLYGAKLAAYLGLPYAFASHFAPAALQEAVAAYRKEFTPSPAHDAPYVIAALNVLAADTDEEAQEQFVGVRRSRVARFLGRGHQLTDEQADQLVESAQGRQVARMMQYSAVGAPATVRTYLEEFRELADADELIVAHSPRDIADRLRSVDLLADALDLVPVPARDSV